MTKKTWMRFVLPVVLLGLVAWQPSGPMLSSPALAGTNTVTVTAGPFEVPGAPVSVCINSDCVTLEDPVATLFVTLTVTATIGTPTITTSACPAPAIGSVFTISTGGTSVTVSGAVSGTLPDGSPFSQPIGPTTVPGLSTVTVSVCASAS